MNLDSLSFTLSQISYLVANLSKKNFEDSCQRISGVSILCRGNSGLETRFRLTSFYKLQLVLPHLCPFPFLLRAALSKVPHELPLPHSPLMLLLFAEVDFPRDKAMCSRAFGLVHRRSLAGTRRDIERKFTRSRNNVEIVCGTCPCTALARMLLRYFHAKGILNIPGPSIFIS